MKTTTTVDDPGRLEQAFGLRVTAILLGLLALCSAGFPLACILRYTLLGYYDDRLWQEYLPLEVFFLPLAGTLAIIGLGLWRRRPWGRSVGLFFGWTVGPGATAATFYGIYRASQTTSWGAAIILMGTAGAFAVALPAWLLVWYLHGTRFTEKKSKWGGPT
ncbi:MAG: hypothetical protein ACREJM_13045 [Candidatus Saccharimonadales bacterium]